FSWPNSSEAISEGWIAPQFTLTSGRDDRSESAWIARATSSLPVPVSPTISTVELVGATSATRFITALNWGLLPTIWSAGLRAPFFFGALEQRAIAWCTAASRDSSSNGLVKNSRAPDFIARTDIGMSPYPVRKMIGICTSALASSSCKSSPLRPGSLTSSTRQLGSCARDLTRKSAADAKVSTGRPAERMRLASDSRTDRSSSTTWTGACVSVIGHLRTVDEDRRPAGQVHYT